MPLYYRNTTLLLNSFRIATTLRGQEKPLRYFFPGNRNVIIYYKNVTVNNTNNTIRIINIVLAVHLL